jgi:hypothetical protein
MKPTKPTHEVHNRMPAGRKESAPPNMKALRKEVVARMKMGKGKPGKC